MCAGARHSALFMYIPQKGGLFFAFVASAVRSRLPRTLIGGWMVRSLNREDPCSEKAVRARCQQTSRRAAGSSRTDSLALKSRHQAPLTGSAQP